jgi:DNA-binding NarL/FixJ family response regulator
MSKAPAIRILIADDHPIVRDGLRGLLEAEPGFEVIGAASDGDQAVRLTQQLIPDILLLDLAMPRVPGLEVLRELAAMSLPVRTILLTATIERSDIVKALQLGARGLVLKESATEVLFKGVRAVMAGQYWLGRESVAELVDTLRALMFCSGAATRDLELTHRELDIVTNVAAGRTNREIAEKFSLTEDTVKHHLTRIFAKLNVSNRVELTSFAAHHHLIR